MAADDGTPAASRPGWQRLLWAGIFTLMALGLVGLVVLTVRLFYEIVLH